MFKKSWISFFILALSFGSVSSVFADKNVYPVSVDYTQSIEQMITAGQYDFVNPEIDAKNLSTNTKGVGKVEVVIELVRFNRYTDSYDAIRELDKMNLRPVTFSELLAFGAKYPDVQRKFLIVALDSFRQYSCGYPCIPFLGSYSGGRGIFLRYGFEGRWRASSWFAAVRK